MGHMIKVNISSMVSLNYFIPRHSAGKPDSTTTTLRVVFNASSKISPGYMLNDLMNIGPTVQRELFSLLIRFRSHIYAFTTDIEKMYRQILLHPDDRKYQPYGELIHYYL